MRLPPLPHWRAFELIAMGFFVGFVGGLIVRLIIMWVRS